MATGTMTPQDVLWLNMDQPTNLMVVDSLVTFAAPVDWDRTQATLEERMVAKFPVFRRVAVVPDGPKARPHWEDDPSYSIDNHIVRTTLPAPGGDDELKAYVSAQRSVPLPKDRPLWVVHCIDGYKGGAAVLVRIHHAVADGIRLTMVVLSMCDNADGGPLGAPTKVGKGGGGSSNSGGGGGGPLGAVKAAAAHAPEAAKGALASVAQRATGALGSAKERLASPQETVLGAAAAAQSKAEGAVGGVLETARSVGDLSGAIDTSMGAELLDPARFEDFAGSIQRNAAILPKLLMAESDPGPWTGKMGVPKLLTWTDALSLDTVKEIGQATGTTVNDILVAVTASALRRYAVSHGHSVGEVVWFVPVNVKPLEENLPEDLGNSFALVLLNMPLDIEDPVVTLMEMKARMDGIKASYEGQLTFGIQSALSHTPEAVYTFGSKFFANKGVGVLSNVPGPKEPIYLAGHEIDSVVGFAPCNGNQPTTVTIFSYNGSVRVGFSGDAGLMPDLDRIPELYSQALADLHAEVAEVSSAPIELPKNLI